MGLESVELIMELEEHFEIQVPDKVYGTVRTVGDLTDEVSKIIFKENWINKKYIVYNWIKEYLIKCKYAKEHEIHIGTRFLQDLGFD